MLRLTETLQRNFPWMKNPRYFLKDWKQSRKRFQPALFFGEESSWMERIIRLENLQPKKHQLGAVNHPSCSINSGIHWSVWMVEWVLERPNWVLLVFSKHKVVFLLSLSPYFCSKIYLKISLKLTVKILCVDIIKSFPLIWVWFCFPLAQLFIGIFKILIFQSLLRWIIFFSESVLTGEENHCCLERQRGFFLKYNICKQN